MVRSGSRLASSRAFLPRGQAVLEQVGQRQRHGHEHVGVGLVVDHLPDVAMRPLPQELLGRQLRLVVRGQRVVERVQVVVEHLARRAERVLRVEVERGARRRRKRTRHRSSLVTSSPGWMVRATIRVAVGAPARVAAGSGAARAARARQPVGGPRLVPDDRPLRRGPRRAAPRSAAGPRSAPGRRTGTSRMVSSNSTRTCPPACAPSGPGPCPRPRCPSPGSTGRTRRSARREPTAARSDMRPSWASGRPRGTPEYFTC